MVKAVLRKPDGKALIIFGLSQLNLSKLVLGQPIHFQGTDIGIGSVEFAIMYGVTEEVIKKDIEENLGK